MSSPPKILRCSVKDLASCFYACRFPPEDEPEIRTDKRRTPKEAKGDSGRAPVTDPRHRSPDSSQAQSFSSKCGAEPRFAEEDYIVFCFRENGEIHMITEGKSPEACHELTNTNTTPTPTIRPINRKLSYDTGDELNRVMVKPDDNHVLLPKKVEGNGDKMVDENAVEQCGSNLSESSCSTAGSFAFPELGKEWIGSPVHLPKGEEDFEEHTTCVELHCCRF